MTVQVRDIHLDPGLQNVDTGLFRELQNTLERIVTPQQIESNMSTYKEKTQRIVFLRNDTVSNPL